MRTEYSILRLTDRPELKQSAAQWFHSKWHIPLEAYLSSMDECLTQNSPVSQCLRRLCRKGPALSGHRRSAAPFCLCRYETPRYQYAVPYYRPYGVL